MSALPQSVVQTKRHSKVSERYTPINTELIIDKLLNNGFELHEAKEARVRKEENIGFQKHLVTLKYTQFETAEGVPTVVIRNSHNRSTGLSLFSGFIRFACFNGLIAGDSIESFNIQHRRSWESDVDQFLFGYEQKIHQMMGDYDKMKNKRMSSYDEKLFAKAVAELRYPIEDYMDYRELTRVKRVEDKGDSLYLVFNRAQENILSGDFERRIITESEEFGKVESWGKAKIITNVEEKVRLNREVYNIAMEFAS